MLKRLTKLATKLDAMGYHDEASALDEICREAASWADKGPDMDRIREMMRGLNPDGLPREEEEVREDEPTPEERLKKEFKGKREDVDPDELSEEDLREDFKTERSDEKFQMDLDPDEDKLVEIMEGDLDKRKMDEQHKEWGGNPEDMASDHEHEEGCACDGCNDAADDECGGREEDASGEAPMAAMLGQLFN